MPLVGMPSLTRLVISNSEYIQCVLSSVTARGSPIRALVLSLSSERVNLWEVRAHVNFVWPRSGGCNFAF